MNGKTNNFNCAQENGICNLPKDNVCSVSYGNGIIWKKKHGFVGGVECKNSVFGDPFPGVKKRCFYYNCQPSVRCSGENSICKLPPNSTCSITYGNNSGFSIKSASNNIGCNNGVFGDPKPGISKECYYYQCVERIKCSNENGICKIPSGKICKVHYGADSRWSKKSNKSGSVPCTNRIFGDPAVGTSKACYYSDCREDLGNSGKEIGVSSWGRGRLDVFIKGKDNAIWHKSYDGKWNEWESLGGNFISGPTAVSWGNNRIDVFATGRDKALMHKSYDGSWSEWKSIKGVHQPGATAASMDNQKLDILVRGTDDALWHKWYDDEWSDWTRLGGELTSIPRAVCWGRNKIHVFVKGKDNKIWFIWSDGSWKNWQTIGGNCTSEPTVASMEEGKLDVFTRGVDNALWHKGYHIRWGGWERLGGSLTSGPSAISWGNNRIDVFARGEDDSVIHKIYDGKWGGWESIGVK